MTQQDVFDMAREVCGKWPSFMSNPNLQAFAKLVEDKVRQELREEIIYTWVPPHFVELAVKEEREACAKVCEDNATDLSEGDWYSACINCADHIRARGEA